MIKMRLDDFKKNMLSSLTCIFLFCFLASMLEAQFWDLYTLTWGIDFSMPLFFYYITDILPIFPILGGLIFGFLADKFNQKFILTCTALFLVVASICVLITSLNLIDQNIMVFVTCCIFIGTIIMMGAEVAVSTAFIFDSSPTHKRGLYLSLVPLIIVSVALFIIAMSFSIRFINFQHLDTWLPIFVIFISLILSTFIFIRRSFFLQLNFYTSNSYSKGNERKFFKFLHVILFSQIIVIFIFYWQYLNNVMRFLSAQDPMNGGLYLFILRVGGILIFVIMLPIWGKIADKTSSYKVFTIGLIGSGLFIAPTYWCLSDLNNISKLVIPVLWFGIFSSALIAPLAHLILELVSSKMRSMTASLLTLGILFLPYFKYGSNLYLFHRYIYFTSYFTIIAFSMLSLILAFIALLISKKLDTLKHKVTTYEVFE